MENTLSTLSIKDKIFTIHGLQVMLDSDLAVLYGVETKVLNQAVKRNSERFPEHFMFQLTEEEIDSLRSQSVTLNNNLKFFIGTSSNNLNKLSLRFQNDTLKKGRGMHRKYLPFAFTEQGVSTLSSVLRSSTAIKVSIQIMDAFVATRSFISKNDFLFARLDFVE